VGWKTNVVDVDQGSRKEDADVQMWCCSRRSCGDYYVVDTL